MISVTGNLVGKYILQPSLIDMHRSSLAWLSTSVLWKQELTFYQKLLDRAAPKLPGENQKKRIDHFQSLITYYGGELVDVFRKKLREHESRLAQMLQEKNESDTVYFKEHESLMDELVSFRTQYDNLKHEFMEFVEKVI
jgi:hypothetical protein